MIKYKEPLVGDVYIKWPLDESYKEYLHVVKINKLTIWFKELDLFGNPFRNVHDSSWMYISDLRSYMEDGDIVLDKRTLIKRLINE